MKYFSDNSDYRIRIKLNNPISFNPEFDHHSETELVGVYIISVAARMLEMHPQTLRKYERLGLVRPSRTVGMLRLYSEEDIVRLELIKHLVGELGLNLAGVRMAIALFNKLIMLKKEMEPSNSIELKKLLSEGIDEMLTILYGNTE
ncbi:MAG: MerR family transcriptional regulator [Chloroflexi bacterium]|nr:MerR family transcriptional regulator [Chloroflexota bacterium]|tara:strand:+ start:1040 stop:1477 length:438 start_codon:yes stop_codon:yes gene_type:complete